jgi:lipopolysaccharide/colanic/teichoic acid biosynthesis glycosyltransferase
LIKKQPNDKLTAKQARFTKIENRMRAGATALPRTVPVRCDNYFNSDPHFDLTRFFDLSISLLGLIILSPVFFLIVILIKISSKGPVIFSQKRVGKNNTDFTLYKFRTMYSKESNEATLTVGNDNRITYVGRFLRRFKLDELPQLYNVLANDMSIVGPRPELRKFVNFYNSSQLEILTVKPGITDYASILFRNENEILARSDDPEKFYIEKIIPIKIRLNKKYKSNKSLKSYFIVIIKTVSTVFG